MRLLLACNECRRQYDASGRAVGDRFHCHCGQLLTIAEPQGHDADVVRCSSCGAPREEGAAACRFCHADFTLRERDLHTVCPECLARVSDRAKFCHHCGVALTPELAFGKESELVCPHCGDDRTLFSRRLGREQVTVLECDHCAGLWLGRDTFARLTERAGRDALQAAESGSAPRAGRPAPGTAAASDRWQYRSCPVCGKMMQRKNYGRKSGVIVDQCREDGLWFDADELPRILAWIRGGGLAAARRQQQEEARFDQQTGRIARAGRTPAAYGTLGDLNADEGQPSGGWDLLFDVVAQIFSGVR